MDFFITVSEKWKQSLSIFLNKKGYVIKNGYDYDDKTSYKKVSISKKLNIIYVGTLYSYQKIEIFINAVKRLSKSNPNSLRVDFYGLEIRPDQKTRLQHLIKGYENVFFIYQRISKKDLSLALQRSDVGLLTAYNNLDGCLPVKIFDYFSHGLNILLCPSDQDEMESFLLRTNSGTFVNNEKECYNELLSFVNNKKKQQINYPVKSKHFLHYSRNHQMSVLSDLLVRH